MAAAFSLIPELDEIVKNGTAEKRAEAIERISGLFLQGAAHFETRHVALFDDILVGLVPATEIETRAELAERLSKLDNAPPTLVKQLARETEIRVSGPILRRCWTIPPWSTSRAEKVRSIWRRFPDARRCHRP